MKQKQTKEYPDAIAGAMEMMDAHGLRTAEEALDYLADDRSHGDEYAADVALELIGCAVDKRYNSINEIMQRRLASFVVEYDRIAVATLVAYIEAEAEIQRARDEVTA